MNRSDLSARKTQRTQPFSGSRPIKISTPPLHPASSSPATSSKVVSTAQTSLVATVKQHTGNQVYELRIGDQTVKASSQRPLNIGQQLTVKIGADGTLLVLNQKSAATSTPQPLLQGLRESLPQAQQLSQALQNLTGQQPQLPSALQKAILTLISQLPTRTEISGESLKAAFNRSGLFMENKLVRLAGNPTLAGDLNQDLKAQLLRLKQLFISQSPQPGRAVQRPEQADNVLKQLSSATQGAIDAITVNQVKSMLPAETQPLFTDLTFQAPNQEPETVKLNIREEKNGANKDEVDSWHFELELNLSRLGQVYVMTAMQQEATNIRFWVTSEPIKHLFESQINQLQNALNSSLSTPLSITVFVGQPATPVDPIKNTNASLLDVSA